MNSTQSIVEISAKAKAEILRIKKENPNDKLGLRLGVKGGGCSGLSYIIDFDEQKENNELLNKTVKEFDLVKSNTNAKENALHLDCCFQPVGKNKAIIHKEGFKNEADYLYLVNLFGMENLFHISKDEMYKMFSNVFSISERVVVSEKSFTRLNNWLRNNEFIVEEIPYAEISKQEGLLRCSTMPLIRD